MACITSENRDAWQAIADDCKEMTMPAHDPRFKGIYCTCYCNHGHDLATGKPIGHECHVIPPLALLAEREGDIEKAVEIMDRASRNGEMRRHTGMRPKQTTTVYRTACNDYRRT